MAHRALEAADGSRAKGSTSRWSTCAPCDPSTGSPSWTRCARPSKALIVSEDNHDRRVSAAEIAALIAEEAFEYLDGPVTRLGGPEVPAMPYNHVLEAGLHDLADQIAEAIRTLAAY